jgi:hypothetical protein
MRGTDPDSESDHSWDYYCNKKIETELNHGSDEVKLPTCREEVGRRGGGGGVEEWSVEE